MTNHRNAITLLVNNTTNENPRAAKANGLGMRCVVSAANSFSDPVAHHIAIDYIPAHPA